MMLMHASPCLATDESSTLVDTDRQSAPLPFSGAPQVRHVSRRGVRPDPNWIAPHRLPRRAADVALGIQLDLFPTVVSAINGKVGYAPQVWAGISGLRLRLVGAHLEPPDTFAFDEKVIDPDLTAIAFIIDRTFGPRFDEFWVCGGVETWLQAVAAKDGSGEAKWVSGVFTVGAGYTWRFVDNFYLDPWIGLHWVLNPQTLQVGSTEYRPAPLVANASVKVGWFSLIGR